VTAWVRTGLVLAAAFYLAFLVIRVALVQSDASKNAPWMAKFWPGHPAVVLESGLVEVGARAAAAEPIDAALVNRLLAASAKAPLAPEPFLVRGVGAQLARDHQLALRAFLAARERSPRTIAARYFLADHYFKAGLTNPGLAEISIIARLVPQSLPSVVPFLADFARSPGATPQVKELLRNHPRLEPVLLETLSDDAQNVDLILALWSGRGGEQDVAWQSRLLAQMVGAGHVELARATWARFTGGSAEPDQLFDPEFGKRTLPPFGWTLASGPAGVAEPEGGGRLHALFYGRDDLALAWQILTLKPGRYRLSMKVEATPSPNALHWTVKCLPSSNEVGLVALDRSGSLSTTFAVPPANCAAQRLELSGAAQQIPQRADVTISQFRLQPEAAQ